MGARRMTQVGKWSRRIGGGALVLALAGLLAPATTSAVTNVGEEVIVIVDEAPEAPWNPSMGMGGHPPGTAPSGPLSGDSGGGGGGPSGGGSGPSGGSTGPSPGPKRLRQ
jgi:hypothetical protein